MTITPLKQPTSLAFDAMGDHYYEDPAQAFADVRDDAPVFFYPYLNVWIVTRREDAELILPDWKNFSSAANGGNITVPEQHQDFISSELISRILVGSDPKGHTLARSVAQRGFVQARMDALKPQIEERAHRIIDRFESEGHANLMDAYCLELTTQTIMALMDLPHDLEGMMRQLRDDFFRILASSQEPMAEPELSTVWDRYVAAQSTLRDIIIARRGKSGDDLITVMANSNDSTGELLIPVEQIAVHLGEFAAAGTDTTAQAMANAVIFLSKKPEYIEQGLADSDLWWRVFDETVRRRPSSPFAGRRANVDITLGGADIKAGDIVWVALASANTDPAHYEEPFDFDIHREDSRDHLSFSKGRHTCLGQPLARVQGATGLKVLYERIPSLRPDTPIKLDFVRMALLPVRRSLGVTWEVDAGLTRDEAEAAHPEQPPARLAPTDPQARLELTVAERRDESDGVVSLVLRDPEGRLLPEWTPGAHIDVTVGDLVRQYSLCSAEGAEDHWRIGVLKEPKSRGGSIAIHEQIIEGSTLTVSLPRNLFVLQPSKKYLFVGGGIGITPILSMIGQADRDGAEWSAIYGGRSRSSMAFLDEFTPWGDKVRLVPEDTDGRVDYAEYLREVREDTLIYCCGPEPLLNALEAATAHWPEGSLHTERFVSKEIDDSANVAFEVEFVDSGITVQIPADKSILDIAEELNLPVISSCGEGTCGTCETPVVSGKVDHRDSILTESERVSCDTMFICVSRSLGGCKLKLEL
ncbi:hypothetical protein GCM10022381_28100 [Leifsonia kafniensis]|uniref:Cytochrome P450 n=1 Tax=Leifsonia kafniensis TaxID=475957 RepID=A0ABP7KSB4_9MICO